MPEEHAKVSASAAHRWLRCPASIAMEARAPQENTSSVYAMEGTFAHTWAERELKYYQGLITNVEWAGHKRKMRKDSFYSPSLEDYVDIYTTTVLGELDQLKGATLDIEKRLDLTDWIPEGFGTADAVIANEDMVIVVDLKYGKGVKVFAEENPQLKLYALGALNLHPSAKKVKTIIVQPRLDHIDSYEYEATGLKAWGEDVKAIALDAFIGSKKFGPSEESCRFCKARAFCSARGRYLESIIKAYDYIGPEVLTTKDISRILSHSKEIKEWLESVESYAYTVLDAGKDIPGYKLVRGRSKRILDQDKAEAILKGLNYPKDVYLKPREMKGVTALEKALGGKKAFEEILGEAVNLQEGKNVIAPESDKRPAINSTDEILKLFEE